MRRKLRAPKLKGRSTIRCSPSLSRPWKMFWNISTYIFQHEHFIEYFDILVQIEVGSLKVINQLSRIIYRCRAGSSRIFFSYEITFFFLCTFVENQSYAIYQLLKNKQMTLRNSFEVRDRGVRRSAELCVRVLDGSSS